MIAHGTQRTRPGLWRRSAAPTLTGTFSASTTGMFSTGTDDPALSVRTLPAPMLNLVFGGAAHGELTVIRAETTRQIDPPPAARPAQVVPLSKASSAIETGLAGPLTAAAYRPADREKAAPEHPHRIELSIDSLSDYLLVEPIPVAIDPAGDDAYTASVPNLDTNVTGHSVVEALLMLKERVEAIYEDLNGRSHLSAEQKTTLQMLHTYIAPKKPEWV